METLSISNKRVLYFHLKKLERHGLVEKKSNGWNLAEGGDAYFKVSLAEALDTIKEASQVHPK